MTLRTRVDGELGKLKAARAASCARPATAARARAAVAGAASLLALLSVLTEADRALAQAPADSVTTIARQRYQDGVTAYEAGRYEDARAAFAQAYALKHHPAVLLNLGQAELRSKHEDDAGNHLQQFLREHTTATPDQRAAAEKGIGEAKRSTGQVTVSVDTVGADVSIDGTTVGKSPLIDPVFVRPGKHTVFGSLDGKSAVAAVDVKIGATAVATLSLGAGGPAPPLPPPVPGQPPPVAPPVQPMPDVQPPPQTPTPPPTTPDTGARMTFGEWYSHKPLAWVGTGLAILGLGMGIGGGVVAMNASNASNADTASIQAEIAKRHDPANVCNPNVLASSATLQMFYGANSPSQACPTLQGDINSYHTGVAVMATGWVFFGVGVVGTAVYATVDWFPQRAGATGSRRGRSELAIVPLASPGVKGLAAMGTF